ncbi:MAG TPA: glycosyltransferase [Vicinamibacterales bacterium]|nr:glycosyltransferase [Vicinamibacterales bacterium]HPW20015.1 glycosyltransferase [Vicinamibacterales bacterium]
MTVRNPDLAVVITTYRARQVVGACLDSLRGQRTSRTFETLLVDSSDDGTAAYVRGAYPEVAVLTSPTRLHAGAARNLAIPHARAPLIAFLDADCTVGPAWVDLVCAAHERPDLLVGGAVENAPTRSLVSWAYYFCEFNLWVPSPRGRYVDEVPGCSLSMKREAFERYGPFVEGSYSSDTAFQWKIRADGHRAWFTPAIRVVHHSPTGLGRFLGHIVEHRRGYARVLCREKQLSAAVRLGRALASPVTPVLMLGVTLWRLRRCPRYLLWAVAASPLVLLGYAARSWGEFRGYLRGRD